MQKIITGKEQKFELIWAWVCGTSWKNVTLQWLRSPQNICLFICGGQTKFWKMIFQYSCYRILFPSYIVILHVLFYLYKTYRPIHVNVGDLCVLVTDLVRVLTGGAHTVYRQRVCLASRAERNVHHSVPCFLPPYCYTGAWNLSLWCSNIMVFNRVSVGLRAK